MKVCYLSNSMLPSRHANSVHVMNMAEGLRRSGAAVTLFAFRGDPALLSSSDEKGVFDFYGLAPRFEIEWLPNPSARGRSVLASLAVWQKLNRLAPDLVLGRHGKACTAAALRGFPTLYETHKPHSWNSFGDRVWLSRLFKAQNFRGMVTISQPLRDILARETALPESRIFVAHDAATPLQDMAPASLGSAGRLQAGYVGAFYPGRGIEMILQLAAALPDVDFHLVGGTREDLSKWHAEGREAANVTYHGFQTPAQAAALRAGCDVLLAPYQRETLIKDGWNTTNWMSPLKVFEYMASAKAILCSDLPVLREVMAEGRNALLLSPDDVSGWIAALCRLRDDRAYTRALGQSALEDFIRHHTWEKRAERILAFASGGQ